ncbi:TonB-dependent receptor [Henriciella sp. AS95]|uniref:TonB-dependent receptor domain-containing protein n=1 Tax=Henriciella sp. AS95 TaxID=3135782 RepID=UPI003171A1D0
MTGKLLYTCARSALVLALGTTFVAAATAQEDDAPVVVESTTDADSGEELRQTKVTVTGSFIAGTPEDAALPVDVFNSAELDASGISSPLEFIKSLPSVGSVLGDTNQFSATAQGAQGTGSINLRNLGSTRNLVLMNGRRTINSPGDGFANTNLIPLFALERIEVLKDGAAATYGSDAISGVANFITKTDFDGIELKGDFTAIDGSDGDTEFSALFGKNFENGNIMIGIGQQVRSELSSTERDFVVQPFEVNPAGWSVLGNPGTYIPKLGDISQGAAGTSLGLAVDGAASGGCEATGGVAGVLSGFPICRFTYIPFDNIVEDQTRTQVYLQADADLAPNFRIHTEALYAKSDQSNNRYSPSFPPTQGPQGPGSAQAFFVPDTNPGYQAFIDQSGLTGGPADPGTPGSFASLLGSYSSILFFRPVGQGGNEELYGGRGGQVGKAVDEAFRVSGGFEWDITDKLTLDTAATFFKSDRLFYTPDVIGQRLQDSLEGFGGENCDRATGTAGVGDCLYFNPFINSHVNNPALGLDNPLYVPGNENSREVLDYMFEPNGTDQSEETLILDTVLSGESGILLNGGNLAYAVGAQYRHNKFSSDPINNVSNADINPCPVEGEVDCALPIGPWIFLGQTRESRLSQSVYAVFGEVFLPIVDDFEATVAVRHEDYGGSIGSTTNPKVSLRYTPTEWLTLRGSAGTTFRGPGPGVVREGRLTTNLAGIAAANNNFKSVDTFGNPGLSPETAFTYNVGAIYDNAGLTVSVDYWSYDFEDELTLTPVQGVANAVGNGPGDGSQAVNCSHPLVDRITFAGNQCIQGVTVGNDIQRVRADNVNGPGVKTSGIDFAAAYDFDLGQGLATIGANGTYTMEYEVREFSVDGTVFAPGFDAVGYSNFDRSAPAISELKGNLFANYALENINLRYTLEYLSGVEDNRGPTDPGTGITTFGVSAEDYIQHDLHGSWTLPVEFAEVQLTGGIENITDEEPAPARLELSYNPFVGNPLGRTYTIGLRLRY